ncbi:MAG: PAS domain-containing protein, partial [Flavobacterium sp.]
MDNSGPEIVHLRKILEASGIGIWKFNTVAGKAILDSTAKKLFGFSEEDTELTKILQNTFIDDVTLINAAVAAATLPSGGNLDIKFRIAESDKKIRWVHVRGSKLKDSNESHTGFEGTIQEIGEELYPGQDNGARFRSLIEQAPVATCLFVGRDMIIELANNLMLGYWGVDNSAIGKKLSEAVPEV